MTRIEETRNLLIDTYGEPVEKMLDGKKYKYINTYLNHFDNLINIIVKIKEKYSINLNENHINAICDFVETEIEPNINYVMKKLQKFTKEERYIERPLIKMFDKLEEFYNSDKYDTRVLMNIFVDNIKCSNINDILL